jgi:cell division protease FtsH
MSFAPPNRQTGTASFTRTLTFWLLMIVLAAALWRLRTSSWSDKPAHSISYSDFMARVDNKNIRTAKLSLAQNTAKVSGAFLAPAAQTYSATVPRDTVPVLTDTLRTRGVRVEVSEARDGNRMDFIAMFGPIVLLVGFWIFMMKQRQFKKDVHPSGTSPDSGPF